MFFSNSSDDFGGMGDFGASPRSSIAPEGSAGSQDQKRRLIRRDNGCMPSTVRMLMTSPHENNKVAINATWVSQVKIVGRVIEQQQSSISVIWRVADQSGVVECRYYSDGGRPEYVKTVLETTGVGCIVAVFGQVRVVDKENVRYISVNQVRPVQSIDEEFYHFLDVARLYLNAGGADAAAGGVKGKDEDARIFKVDVKKEALDYSGVPSGFKGAQRAVAAILLNGGFGESGAPKQHIIKQAAKAGFGAEEVSEAIAQLDAGGEIFNADDTGEDEVYAPTFERE